MPEKKQLTRGSLERQIRARVKQAHDKGIVSKVFSAGQAFFHQRYSPDRHYEPEATFVIHQSWDEGSEYTRFDVSVSTFTNISNDARITIRLRMWRWGSGCEVTLIGPDQTQQTVLRVDTTDKRDDPSIIDGHLYACYVLGPWEQQLGSFKSAASNSRERILPFRRATPPRREPTGALSSQANQYQPRKPSESRRPFFSL